MNHIKLGFRVIWSGGSGRRYLLYRYILVVLNVLVSYFHIFIHQNLRFDLMYKNIEYKNIEVLCIKRCVCDNLDTPWYTYYGYRRVSKLITSVCYCMPTAYVHTRVVYAGYPIKMAWNSKLCTNGYQNFSRY